MKRIKYYLKIWFLMSKNSFTSYFYSKFAFSFYLVGKLIRFGLFFSFLFFLVEGVDKLAGYNLNETLLIFLTFNLVDVVAQFLFREVYRFRPQVVSGSFDLTLTKPVSALFRSLMGGADVIDLVTIPPLILAVVYIGSLLNASTLYTTYYILLTLNGLLIATAFHIAVLGLGIITLEIDHTIMIYRDLLNLGRFPVDIYREPLRSILTYLIPVALMITLPVRSLMGLVTPLGVIGSFALGILTLFVATKFWKFALRFYTSASN